MAPDTFIPSPFALSSSVRGMGGKRERLMFRSGRSEVPYKREYFNLLSSSLKSPACYLFTFPSGKVSDLIVEKKKERKRCHLSLMIPHLINLNPKYDCGQCSHIKHESIAYLNALLSRNWCTRDNFVHSDNDCVSKEFVFQNLNTAN